MKWSDNLRPASFRGVRFEVDGSSKAGGRRGVHREYPGHDRGDVEDLGLADAALSLTGYVIGDDVLARRDALEAALDQPGSGILIHPSRGRMEVMLDPQRRWRSRESAQEGRAVRFQLNFIRARDLPRYPEATPERIVVVAGAAAAIRDSALARAMAGVTLGGPSWLREDAVERMTGAVERFEAVAAVAQAPDTGDLAEDAASPISSGAAMTREAFDAALERADTDGALTALAALSLDVFTVMRDGQRQLRSAAGVSAAAGIVLDVPALALPDAGIIAPGALRSAQTAYRIDRLTRLIALSHLAEATARRTDFDSAEAALAGMQALDILIEAEIRTEGREAVAAPGRAIAAEIDPVMRELSDLRARSRSAMLDGLADQRPVIRRESRVSMPSLALTWTLTGGIAAESDLLRRNAIAHPLFCPAGNTAFREAGDV